MSSSGGCQPSSALDTPLQVLLSRGVFPVCLCPGFSHLTGTLVTELGPAVIQDALV